MLRKIGLAVAVARQWCSHRRPTLGMVMEDMDTAMATLIGTMVTGTTGMGTVMADGGAATGMATVSVHAGAGHPADTSGFATSRDLLISGNSGRRFRTGVLLFQGGSGVA